jgi:hypothetical protein
MGSTTTTKEDPQEVLWDMHNGVHRELEQELRESESRMRAAENEMAAAKRQHDFVTSKLKRVHGLLLGHKDIMQLIQSRPHDETLKKMLAKTQSGWEKLKREGADDARILMQLKGGWRNYQQDLPNSSGRSRFEGGDRPRVWIDADYSAKPTFEGKALAAEIRRVMGMPQPKAKAPAKPKSKPKPSLKKSAAAIATKAIAATKQLTLPVIEHVAGKETHADPPKEKRGGGDGMRALTFAQWFAVFGSVYFTERRRHDPPLPTVSERDVRVHELFAEYPRLRPSDAARKLAKQLATDAKTPADAIKVGDRVTCVDGHFTDIGTLKAIEASHLLIHWDGDTHPTRVPLDRHVRLITPAEEQKINADAEQKIAAAPHHKGLKAKKAKPQKGSDADNSWSGWKITMEAALPARGIDPRRADVQRMYGHLFNKGFSPGNAVEEIVKEVGSPPLLGLSPAAEAREVRRVGKALMNAGKKKTNGATAPTDPAAIAAGSGGAFAAP